MTRWYRKEVESAPSTEQPVYLIENSTLRTHLGKLIGQIAASHHWSIEDVESKLPHQVNSLSGFPREWRIDPIKIACMLRCADAAHIDNERAPDFLHALIKRRGISFRHWQAQNKLASVDIDQSDSSGSTLLFTSTQKFLEQESEAWWVAFDTVCMIEKEIRSSNTLLQSKQIEARQFQVKRVMDYGVSSLEKCFLAYSLCHFDIDPIDVANVCIVRNEKVEIVSFEQLAALSESQQIVFVKSYFVDHVDSYTQISSLPGKVMIKPLRISNYLSLKLKDGTPDGDNTLLGCLYRSIEKLGRTPKIGFEMGIGSSLLGKCDGLIVTSTNQSE